METKYRLLGKITTSIIGGVNRGGSWIQSLGETMRLLDPGIRGRDWFIGWCYSRVSAAHIIDYLESAIMFLTAHSQIISSISPCPEM